MFVPLYAAEELENVECVAVVLAVEHRVGGYFGGRRLSG